MTYSSQYSHYHRKSGQPSRWKKLLLILLLIVIAAAMFFGIREARRDPSWLAVASQYGANAKSWVIERKQHLNQTVASVKKQVGDQDEGERVVNFEFYNTLQEMKSMQVEATARVNQTLEQKELAKAPVAVPSPVKAKKTIKMITQADDLEKDLLSAIKQPRGGK